MSYDYDCFISYAHKENQDSGFVQQLAGWLERAGLNVWRDRSGLAGGRPITNVIRRGLASSRCLVCLVTEGWYASKFAQWEREGFLAQADDERPVVPVLYHDDDRTTAEALQQDLRRAEPPIRLAMQPNRLVLAAPMSRGHVGTWPGASPNRITIFLVED